MKRIKTLTDTGVRLRTNLVILDGPRCSGKSTIAQALVATLNQQCGVKAEYFKKGVPDLVDEAANMDVHLFNFWDRINSGQVDVIVVDRFVATEFVMALATGRTPPERVISYCRLTATKLYADWHAVNAVLLPSLTTLEERMEQRPEDHRWDMDKHRIHPLWELSRELLPGVQLISNESSIYGLVDDLVRGLIMTPPIMEPKPDHELRRLK